MQNVHLRTGRRLVGVPTIAAGGTDELVLFGRYATSPVSPTLQVGAAPMVLKAYGLLDGETVTVQNVYVPTGEMSPYSYKGDPIILTNAESTALLVITGNYRLVFAGAMLGAVLVTATTLAGQVGEVDVASLRSQLAEPNLFFGPGITNTISKKLQVTSRPWVMRAYNLPVGTEISVLNATTTADGEVIAPYTRDIASTVLTQDNDTLVLELAGSYRFEIVGNATGVLLVGNENAIDFIDPYIPQGPQGIPGPPGPGKTFVFLQPVAASEWVIKHNLGRFPSVTVVDSAGNTAVGAYSYINDNIVVLDFSAPFAGAAYLN